MSVLLLSSPESSCFMDKACTHQGVNRGPSFNILDLLVQFATRVRKGIRVRIVELNGSECTHIEGYRFLFLDNVDYRSLK